VNINQSWCFSWWIFCKIPTSSWLKKSLNFMSKFEFILAKNTHLKKQKDIWKKTRIDSTHCSYQTLLKKDKSTYLLIFGTGDGFSFQLQNLDASLSHQAAMTTDHLSNWQHLSHSCTPCQKHVADHTIFSSRTWTMEWHKFETRAVLRQSKFYTQQSRRVKAYLTWSWFCWFLPSHFSLLSVSLNKF
jgi:hypothetical protein